MGKLEVIRGGPNSPHDLGTLPPLPTIDYMVRCNYSRWTNRHRVLHTFSILSPDLSRGLG